MQGENAPGRFIINPKNLKIGGLIIRLEEDLKHILTVGKEAYLNYRQGAAAPEQNIAQH